MSVICFTQFLFHLKFDHGKYYSFFPIGLGDTSTMPVLFNVQWFCSLFPVERCDNAAETGLKKKNSSSCAGVLKLLCHRSCK
jgi:hypothetical protein